MNKTLSFRIILDVLIAVSLLNGWWFFALLLSIAGCYFFSYFVEGIVAGVIYDSLFGFVAGMGVRAFAGTIIMVVVTCSIAGLKTVLRKG